MTSLETICIYDGSEGEIKVQEIAEYVREKLGEIKIEIREDIISYSLKKKLFPLEIIATKLVQSRVVKINERIHSPPVLPMMMEYEKKNKFIKTKGIVYDGVKVVSIFSELIPEEEFNLKWCHIVITNQLVSSWDTQNKRYHLRVGIYGFPSLISVPGIIEAPAKPKEFYLKIRLGINRETVKKELKGKFIDYKDKRLTEILKGYILQALFFHLTGEPFCSVPYCRFYNAHWQKELICAQLEGKEFCEFHYKLLEKHKS
jgi:hypothetical protein